MGIRGDRGAWTWLPGTWPKPMPLANNAGALHKAGNGMRSAWCDEIPGCSTNASHPWARHKRADLARSCTPCNRIMAHHGSIAGTPVPELAGASTRPALSCISHIGSGWRSRRTAPSSRAWWPTVPVRLRHWSCMAHCLAGSSQGTRDGDATALALGAVDTDTAAGRPSSFDSGPW